MRIERLSVTHAITSSSAACKGIRFWAEAGSASHRFSHAIRQTIEMTSQRANVLKKDHSVGIRGPSPCSLACSCSFIWRTNSEADIASLPPIMSAMSAACS